MKTPPPTLAELSTVAANTASLSVRGRELNDTERAAITAAFSTRGDKLLLSNAPKDDWAKAAWNGLQPNPYKISMGAMLFLPKEPQDFLHFLSTNVRMPARADRDAGALQSLGVW